METFIENENLKLKISTFGAEIQQIINKKIKKIIYGMVIKHSGEGEHQYYFQLLEP